MLFGLGIDCGDIVCIIHWRPPNTLEELVQETGCTDRNGMPSKAIIYYGKPGRHMDKAMVKIRLFAIETFVPKLFTH